MTASRPRAWFGLTPLIFLLGALLGMASPGPAGAERVVEAAHKLGPSGGRVVRSGAHGTIVESLQSGDLADVPVPGPAPALAARELALGRGWATAFSVPARSAPPPVPLPNAYDPRGPPSTTA